MDTNVRVRFAPSPTGALHIGGVRTALYNYLFAKKLGGKMILRIEDTDSTRFVPGAEQYIKDSFDWLGITFDEGPDMGGDFGPYRQSERKDLYYDYAIRLVSEGKAYFAFDSSDELNTARENIENFSYNNVTRNSMKNSLTMSDGDANEIMKTSQDFVIRIKYPDTPIDIKFNDMIRGEITINSGTLDDKVIWKKKDNLPTYHLANVVDDHLMDISHVIRGEEWIPSTPLHIYLYDIFGWDKPLFAHLPLILGPNGKLSKRDGDKFGFPVYPLAWTDPKTGDKSSGYKSMGYNPNAVINILAFLGWNPGTEKEIYTMDELIQDFDMSRVNKAGAKFNVDKAKWFNGQHLRDIDNSLLLVDFINQLRDKSIDMSDDNALKILEANKGKVNFVKDIFTTASYLFNKPSVFDAKGLKKWKPTSAILLTKLKNKLVLVSNWVETDIQNAFEAFVKDNGIKFGDVGSPLRLVLTGKANGPSLFGIMELLGKVESLDRLVNYDLPKADMKVTATDDNKPLIEKLKAELQGVSKALTGTEKKLSNPNFVDRAPKDVVATENQKLGELTVKKKELITQLDDLR